MIAKTFSYMSLLGVLCLAAAACEKEPSLSDLDDDYLVYTASDPSADFSLYETFYLPDSILVIGTADRTVYWSDRDAQSIVDAVAANMERRHFVRVDDRAAADLGLQLSYVEQVTYFVGCNDPYWWWSYPYYWSPGYWGEWLGWHYPFPVYYGYTAGSLLTELLDLESETGFTSKLPVLWDSFISGLVSPNTRLDLRRTVRAVDQAFAQSPELVR